jgi:hypothetical protein
MNSIVNTLSWVAIKEAISIIEKFPLDLQSQVSQLTIINKYVTELKSTVRYKIEQGNKSDCCGDMRNND